MDDILLTKYLLKEANETEASEVRKWLAEHPDHEKQYAGMQWIWNASNALQGQLHVDEEAAWNRFVRHRNSLAPRQPQRSSGQLRPLRWLYYAAAVLLIPLTAVLLIYYFGGSGSRVQATYETAALRRTDTLADGTVITLNSFSALRYSQNPSTNRRSATLEDGEVFFKVKQDPKKPFVVQSGEISITVLGTAFHVKRRGAETEVIVENGRVRVAALEKQAELGAKQRVAINTVEKKFEESMVADQLHNYYVDNRFVLEDTPLWRIVEVLNEAYDTAIVIENPRLRKLTLTTTLRLGDLADNLHVISETLGIQVEQAGNKFILK